MICMSCMSCMLRIPPSYKDFDKRLGQQHTMRDICSQFRQEVERCPTTISMASERALDRIKWAGAPQCMVRWSNQRHSEATCWHHPTSGTWRHDRLRPDSWTDGESGADYMKQHGGCLPSTLYPIELQVRAAMTSGRHFEVLGALSPDRSTTLLRTPDVRCRTSFRAPNLAEASSTI